MRKFFGPFLFGVTLFLCGIHFWMWQFWAIIAAFAMIVVGSDA